MEHGLFKDGDESTELQVEYTFIDSTKKLLHHKDEIESLEGVIGLDTETTGLDPYLNHIVMLQLSDGDKTFVIDARTSDIHVIKSFLETSSFVMHNASFDYSMLRGSKIALSNVYCTMVGEQVVSAGKRFGESYKLNAVANKRLGIVLDKDPSTSFLTIGDAPFSEIQKLYGARDAFILPEIRNQQLMDADEYGLHRILDLEMSCIIPISEMQLRGCVIDKEKWMFILQYAHVFENRVGKKLKEVFEEVDMQPTLFGMSSINLNSQPQLLKMMRRFGLDLESTSSVELEDHLGEHVAVDWLLEYRTYEKVRAAYGDELLKKINPITGRLHPKFNQARAKTGRMSSCFPKGTRILTKSGYKNIENINQGELVATRFGFKPVKDQWLSGQDVIYTVKLRNGFPLEITGNHPILTPTGWVTVENLKENDVVYLTQTTNLVDAPYIGIESYYDRKFTRVPYRVHPILDESLSELLGYAIGDGHLRKGRTSSIDGRQFWDKLTLAISWEDMDLVNYFTDKIKSLFGVDVSYREGTSREVQITSTKICMMLSKFGLGLKSINARVPKEIFDSNYKVVGAFLRGLFEADGCISNGNISLKSSSLFLLKDVGLLLEQFGILFSIAECMDTSGYITKNKRYQLELVNNLSHSLYRKYIGFLSIRKDTLLKNYDFSFKKNDSSMVFSPPYNSWEFIRREMEKLDLVKHLMPDNEFQNSLSQFFRNGRNISFIRLNKIYDILKSFNSDSYTFKFISNILETHLFQSTVKSISKGTLIQDVYDLCIEDIHEFQVQSLVVKNSSPNAQNIPAPKELQDKLVEIRKSELPSEVLNLDYTKPTVPVDDVDAKASDRYTLIYEKGIYKYYIDSNDVPYIYVYDFRDCFISAPGRNIVQCDMPKAEICIMAHMSQDKKLIEAINSGEDVYKRAAAESLHIAYDAVVPAQRKIYKAVVLGLAYGLSSFGLARNIKITEDHANEVINNFKGAFPVLNSWLEKEGKAALMRCYALTQMGRRLFLPFDIDPTKDPMEADLLRMSNERRGKNHPMQGGNADLTKLALAMIYKEIVRRKLNAGLQLVVHDEFVGEAVEDQAEEMGQIMVDKVQEAFKMVYPSVIVKPEYNIGKYWVK